jgi:hypothetical protein
MSVGKWEGIAFGGLPEPFLVRLMRSGSQRSFIVNHQTDRSIAWGCGQPVHETRQFFNPTAGKKLRSSGKKGFPATSGVLDPNPTPLYLSIGPTAVARTR